MPPESEFLTVQEVAARLRVSVSTVRHWVLDKRLESYRVGGRRLFKREDIDKFIEQGKTEAEKK